MPTYEYECKECGHSFEVFQSMSDEPLKVCTKCGSEVRRLICGGAGVIFKGSGFYVTDKASGKDSGKSKAPSSAKPKTAETGAAQNTPAPSASSDTKKADAVTAAQTA
ncbi:MAG: zinc ribbon domain-containing protein [Treponema sp.]|jgi:putative FmdB family regulatory protein|nr:zinc ribbon domain-containing protein [Treponema sp.]